MDPAGRFEALTVTDVRAEVQQKYAANSIFTLEEKNRHTELSGSSTSCERRKGRWSTKALVAYKCSWAAHGTVSRSDARLDSWQLPAAWRDCGAGIPERDYRRSQTCRS